MGHGKNERKQSRIPVQLIYSLVSSQKLFVTIQSCQVTFSGTISGSFSLGKNGFQPRVRISCMIKTEGKGARGSSGSRANALPW